MEDKKLHNPHDNIFNILFSRKETAVTFIQYFLDASIVDLLDFDRMDLAATAFSSDDFSKSFADLVWRIGSKDGEELDIVFLFEHKSYPDDWVRFQVLQYMTGSWTNHRKEGTLLRRIVPIVIYHGAEEWTPPLLGSLFQGQSQGWEQFTPEFEILFFSLSHIPQEQYLAIKNKAVALQLMALARVFSSTYEEDISAFLLVSNLDFDQPDLRVLLDPLFSYIFAKAKDRQVILKAINQIPSLSNHINMTIAEVFIQQGLEQGIEQGLELGLEQGIQQGNINRVRTVSTKLILKTNFDDAQIADLVETTVEFVAALRKELTDKG